MAEEEQDAAEETSGRLTEIEYEIAHLNSQYGELIELAKDIKSFARILHFIRGISEWVVKVAAAVVIIWAVFRYGVTEVISKAGNSK